MLDELAEPITTIASQRGAIAINADCRFVVAKHRSLRPGTHTLGQRSCDASSAPAQSRCDKVVCASSATGSGSSGRARDVVGGFDAVHRVGRDRHRADGLLVALMADVDDAVSLARADADLVVHLRDERAHRIDDVAAGLACRRDDLGGGSVRREHEGSP